jgi:uncharacterized membrane protein HdeD (DUF308 family)
MSANTQEPTLRSSRIGLGVVMMIVGITLVAWPGATVLVVVTLFGIGVLVYGVVELRRVFAGGDDHLDLVAGLVALVNIFGGVVIVATRFVSLGALAVVLGVYWVVAGVIGAAGGLSRKDGRIERVTIGLLSLVAGVLVLTLPALSLVALVWFAGLWLVLVGAIVAGLTVVGGANRRFDDQPPPLVR